MPKSLRSATSIVCEEGFVERGTEGTAGGIADAIVDGIADGIAEGQDRNGFACSEAVGEGSVRSGGGRSMSGGHDRSVSDGSAGSLKGAAAESGGGSPISGEGRSVSGGVGNTGLIKGCNWQRDPLNWVAWSRV